MKHLTVAATIAALALTLSACGSDTQTDAGAPTATGTSASQGTLQLRDGWAKAATKDMTAAFGTLKNTGSSDLVVTGGSSDVAESVEAHVMVKDDAGQMVMQEAKDGLVIPAGKELTLEPGGAHLMLMGLKGAVEPGHDITITVSFKDGSSEDLTFPVREFDGAKESYSPSDSSSSMSH